MKGKLKKIDKEKLPIYEIVVDEYDETGISLISLVEEPAIVMKGMLFSEEKTIMAFKEVDDEKQIIVGPALIPNMKIYREDEKYGQYYVVFSQDTITKMVEKFNKYGSNRRINVDHSNRMVDAYILEDWIVEDAVYDKSRKYGFEVPVGTYMIKVKIEDKEFWNEEVKNNGKFGFSIEGLLGQQLVSLTKQDESIATIDDLTLDDLISIFNEIKLESYADYPDGVKNNAKKVLDWTEKNGWGSCGTPVGKQRANQLAKGEAISLQTIKRMYSYLSRHEADLEKSTSFSDGCGYLMYMSWGGKAALGWSRNKLRGLGELNEQSAVFVADSSNVDRIKYFEDERRLVVKFNDGSYYTYFEIDDATFKNIIAGDAVCKTAGENEYGEWFIGKTPSVGAAIWKYLIDKNVRFEEGGSFR